MIKYLMNLVSMMQVLTSWALSSVRVAVTQQVPVFSQGVNSVSNRLQIIENLNQLLRLTGIAADKHQARVTLKDITLSIILPVKAFAIAQGNQELKAKVSYTSSSLMKMRANNLTEVTEEMHALITPYVAEMQEAGYAIDETLMDSWKLSIDAFKSLQNKPRLSITERKTLNSQVDKMVRETYAICKDVLDPNSVSFKAISAEYYEGYVNARKVQPSGNHHTRFETVVTDEDGNTIYGVTVKVDTLQKDGKTYQAKETITDLAGKAIVSAFEPGVRSVTVSGPGIETQTFGPYQFKHGKKTEQPLTVKRVFTNIPAPQEKKVKV